MTRFFLRLVTGALLLAAGQSTAADATYRLTEQGTPLGSITTSGDLGDLRFTVVIDSDVVSSTHIWAVVAGTQMRQRTNEGYWIPWSGRTEDLIDNRLLAKDGQIEFKVFDGNLGIENQGVALVIGYRVGNTLKYGVFGVIPAATGGGT